MAAGDRLSNLPDDLLRRILYFAPAKDGACTSVLARRWRFIWRSSGAVNLDSRSYNHLHRVRRRDVIMRDAYKALAAAAHGRVTKFTFRYEEGADDRSSYMSEASYDNDMLKAKGDMARELESLVQGPETSHVEELRLGLFYGMCNDSPATCVYDLRLRHLSCSGSLRVLHVSKCMDFELWHHPNSSPPASSMTPPFPRLVELRLHGCCVSLSILQGLIDAAPHLATLHLDGVEPQLSNPTIGTARSLHLRCRTITNLLLANLHCWGPNCQNTMEVEAPLLRSFAYEGPIRSLSLKSSPPDLARVDLRFHVPAQVHTTDGTWQLFWRLISHFSGANTINLNFQLSHNTCVGDLCC